VYMPINAGGVHWVTGAINLADSIFYVFDSMESQSTMLMLEQKVRDWTLVINRILEMRGNSIFTENLVGKYKSKGQRTAKQKVKVLLHRKSTYCQLKIKVLPWIKES
ncbi:phospholipase-like protein, partial [Tanacetum coccineum]